MKLNKKQIIFLVVAVLLGVVIQLLPESKRGLHKPQDQTKAQIKTGESLAHTSKELKDLMNSKEMQKKPMKYMKYSDRNPFKEESVKLYKDLTLQGVFQGSDKPSAIINNKVLGLGEKIDEKVVSDIKNDYVVLIDATGKQTMLSMNTAFPTHVEAVDSPKEETNSATEP